MHDLVHAKQDELAALCRRFSARRLGLFGSATGERFDPEASDLDFLVEFEPSEPGSLPPLAPDIELAGGEYVDGAAVVDGNMVSCRSWGDLAEWSRAFLECLDREAVPA